MKKLINKNKIWLDKNSMHRVLDDEGKVIDINYTCPLSNKQLLDAYNYMILSRQQDTYMLQLQRQGRMLTFAPNFGEEALQVAAGISMTKDDWFVPAFRSNATMLVKGVTVKQQLLYWNGNENGSKYNEGVNVMPINIPIATQYSHAAGIAYALKLQNKKAIAMTFIGDGGTSEGEFYEAMNIASVQKWPVVFAINNNQFAISTRTSSETAALTLAAKAVAAGIPAIRVDGNDLLASYDAFIQAVEWAKSGKGPILVECFTWREGQHTTSDDPKVYRTKEEEESHKSHEPMHRIKQYLIDQNILTEEEDKKIWESKLAFVKVQYQESLKEIEVNIDDVFDYTYKELTPELKEQKILAKKYMELEGK